MGDTVAATSLIGSRPMCRDFSFKDASHRKKSSNYCWFPQEQLVGRRFVSLFAQFPGLKIDKLVNTLIKASTTELTREVYSYREEEQIPRFWNYRDDSDVERKPGLWPPENKADDPALYNPFLRQERMGCGWLGAIFEWEGVIVEDNPDIEKQAWLALAQEEGKLLLSAFILRR